MLTLARCIRHFRATTIHSSYQETYPFPASGHEMTDNLGRNPVAPQPHSP